MEIGYYDRTINWNEPLFVHPERQPDLYAQHRSDLCEHGYRITTTSRGYHGECPDGCKAATA